MNQFGVIRINVNRVGIFLIPIWNQVGVIPIYIFFCPTCLTLKLFFALRFFLEILLSLRFPTKFSVSFFIVPCHGKTLLTRSDILMTKSKISQLIRLVLVTCGHGLPMDLNGFIAILSSTFRPKSTIIPLPLF